MSRNSLRLLASAFALCATSAWAQADNPARGADLWSDTPGLSGVNTLTNSCSNCHEVSDRRTSIGGSAFADISFDTAMTRFAQAVQVQSVMQQFQALPLQDARDIAAYIADTPKTSESALDFSATAVNTTTAAQAVVLRHSAAPLAGATLAVTNVAITGAGASAFAISSNACNGANLAASNSCQVGVTFNAPDTAGKSATLTFSLRQGTTNFSRNVALSGAVAGSSPPPSSDSGGGALGFGWLAALASAVLALAAASRGGSDRVKWRRARSRCA